MILLFSLRFPLLYYLSVVYIHKRQHGEHCGTAVFLCALWANGLWKTLCCSTVCETFHLKKVKSCMNHNDTPLKDTESCTYRNWIRALSQKLQ